MHRSDHAPFVFCFLSIPASLVTRLAEAHGSSCGITTGPAQLLFGVRDGFPPRGHGHAQPGKFLHRRRSSFGVDRTRCVCVLPVLPFFHPPEEDHRTSTHTSSSFPTAVVAPKRNSMFRTSRIMTNPMHPFGRATLWHQVHSFVAED